MLQLGVLAGELAVVAFVPIVAAAASAAAGSGWLHMRFFPVVVVVALSRVAAAAAEAAQVHAEHACVAVEQVALPLAAATEPAVPYVHAVPAVHAGTQ